MRNAFFGMIYMLSLIVAVTVSYQHTFGEPEFSGILGLLAMVALPQVGLGLLIYSLWER